MPLRAARTGVALAVFTSLPLLLTTAPRAGAVPTPEEYACEGASGYPASIPTTLVASPAPSGANVTVTATIGSAIDRGTVTSYFGSTPLGSVRYTSDPTVVGFGPGARRPNLVEFDPDDESGLCASSGGV